MTLLARSDTRVTIKALSSSSSGQQDSLWEPLATTAPGSPSAKREVTSTDADRRYLKIPLRRRTDLGGDKACLWGLPSNLTFVGRSGELFTAQLTDYSGMQEDITFTIRLVTGPVSQLLITRDSEQGSLAPAGVLHIPRYATMWITAAAMDAGGNPVADPTKPPKVQAQGSLELRDISKPHLKDKRLFSFTFRPYCKRTPSDNFITVSAYGCTR